MPQGRLQTLLGYSGSSTQYGIDLTAGGTNTKGSYATVGGPLPFAASGAYVLLMRSNTARRFLIDVAYETPGGSTTVWAANLVFTAGDDPGSGCSLFDFPAPIPAGVTLKARCQSADASAQTAVAIFPYVSDGLLSTLTALTTYGASTGTSIGTQVDPGGSANTKGSWVSLGTLTAAIEAFTLRVAFRTNQLPAFAMWKVDIGVGATPVPIVSNLVLQGGTDSDAIFPPTWRLPLPVANGSLLSIRAQCSITDATDRVFDAILIGEEGTVVSAYPATPTPIGWMTGGAQILRR